MSNLLHTCKTKITPKPSTGNGDLDGFQVECTCGFYFTTMFEITAKTDAALHVQYMANKIPARKKSNRSKPDWMPK